VTSDELKEAARRGFLKSAAGAIGAASLIAVPEVEAAAPARRLRIGAHGVGASSFTSYCWSDLIAPDKPANSNKGNFGTPFLNMDITHVWDVEPATSQKYAARLGATAVPKYDDMVGKVDGVIFGGFWETPWHHLLARPYLEAGIPIYLSRPFAYRMRDIDAILELAAKHGTAIMATAKHEHYNEVATLKSRIRHVTPIQCVQATCNAADFPMHLHTQFMLLGILGYDVEKVSLITDSVTKNNYLQQTFVFKGWEGQKPFVCSLQGSVNEDSFWINIMGRENQTSATMVRSPNWRDSLLYRYAPQVIDMQRTFETKKNWQPLEEVRKKTEVFLTSCYSHYERGGAAVTVGSVPSDWAPPHPKPGWIDEAIFKS
jgi:hypothetical protein